MNVDFSPAQLMLHGVIARRLGPRGDLRSTDPATRWAEYAEAGFLGLSFNARGGQPEQGSVEAMIFMEEAGRAGIDDAFVPTVVQALGILEQMERQPLAIGMAAAVARGAMRLSVLADDPDQGPCAIVARASRAGWLLNGACRRIAGACEADQFLVPALVAGRGDAILLRVDRRAPGVSVTQSQACNGPWSGAVSLDGVAAAPSDRFMTGVDITSLLRRSWDHVTAARCAQTVGVMASLVDLAVGRVNELHRHAAVLPSLHALRHGVADMTSALELARSASMAAASACQHGTDTVREIAVSRAKLQINRTARAMVQTACRLLSWPAQIDEAANALFEVLIVSAQLHGDDGFHLRRLLAHSDAPS